MLGLLDMHVDFGWTCAMCHCKRMQESEWVRGDIRYDVLWLVHL